jgi:NAD(P)-dependent dehydrogenase (short-subunit alcohol dehydrogenase family)
MALPKQPRAVITGAGSGLGRALSLELAGRGARLLLADIDEAGLAITAKLTGAAGAETATVRCDVSSAAEVEALAVSADERMGGTDLVINNAGVAVGGLVGEIPLADWTWIMGVNLWGVVHGCHSFLPRMKRQKSGHVLNIASTAGLIHAPGMGPYNVTKAGVVALSETLAAELVDTGVGVTVLCPTFFKTNIFASSRTTGEDAARAPVDRLMARARIQADGVARYAIDSVAAGRLHALPHEDGRWLWRAKRAAPGFFSSTVLGKGQRFLMK